MNARALRPVYPLITPAERRRLVLDALLRRDLVELSRLRWSCPPAQLQEYTALLDQMRDVGVVAVFCEWLDISHRVVRAHLGRALLPYLVLVDEVRLCGGPRADRKNRKILVRKDHGLVVETEAAWKQRSAEWKGIDAAVMRFCAERLLTRQELFVMMADLSPVIDEARAALDTDVPADPERKAAIYQILSDAIPAHKADGSGSPIPRSDAV